MCGVLMASGVWRVISIVDVRSDGSVNLKKEVKQHLGADNQISLSYDDEVVLSMDGEHGLSLNNGRSIKLPEETLQLLAISPKDKVALIEREKAVAVKRFTVEEADSEKTRIIDMETPLRLTRRVEGRLNPENELERIIKNNKGMKLKHDPHGFLRGRGSLEAWKARQILGIHDPIDEELREVLIKERTDKQSSNGSWDNHSTSTAQMLRDLADLGLNREVPEVARGTEWLLDRSESPHNPGMFFLNDGLVEEQVELIKEREKIVKGPKPRFRKLLSSENKEMAKGDRMVKLACGPRLMWPNSLILEPLLRLGYEDHERIQRALHTLRHAMWCECGYQHGSSGWRLKKPQTDDEIGELESDFMNQYKYLGLMELEELAKLDLTRKVGLKLRRVSEEKHDNETIYELSRFDHVQGCEFMTMRALETVQDPVLRRIVEAYLWRIAAVQKDDGRFIFHTRSGKYQNNMFHDNQAGFLEFFSRFDHPASHIVIQRALPWIIENQNPDGSWGETDKDIATLAVLKALKRINYQFS